jgi:hypothetical protein
MKRTYTVVLVNLLLNKPVERVASVGLAEAIIMTESGNKIYRLLRLSDEYREAYRIHNKLTEAQVERLCGLSWAIEELLGNSC